ncbi:MAG: serine hydrolase domain-containing protein [Christensenellales bacterium]|jgi:CubicO group peptidase (beta-lactamase class C family)
MELRHTQALIRQKISERYMDTCVVYVSLRGETGMAFSENADKDTLFDIASMGKVLVTSPLVLKAVRAGHLSLQSTLGEIFSDVPEDKAAITVQQLLTHTSGVLRYEYPAEVGRAGHKAVLRYILDSKLGFKPGTDFTYSCNGMMLLGFMLEKLYGKKLDEIWREQMKTPLGLTRSEFNIPVDAENAAVSYHWREVGSLRADDVNVLHIGGISGAGGQYWTARDIATYCQAVMEKSPALYPLELFALAEKDYTPNGQQGRGLGWLMVDERYAQTGKLFPNGSFGHTGWTGTAFHLNREKELFAIVLTNSTRWTFLRENFRPKQIDEITHQLRRELYNEIHRDLTEKGLLEEGDRH